MKTLSQATEYPYFWEIKKPTESGKSTFGVQYQVWLKQNRTDLSFTWGFAYYTSKSIETDFFISIGVKSVIYFLFSAASNNVYVNKEPFVLDIEASLEIDHLF